MDKNVIWNRQYLVVLSIIFFSFLVLNIFTPFNGDDYLYAFKYSDRSRIENIKDVFESQCMHYQVVNGRFVPHIFEQIFSGITGKWLFNLLNALMQTILVFLVVNRICLNDLFSREKYVIMTAVSFLACLFLFSYPGQSMLWMAGGLNYLWPTVLALVLLSLFEKNSNTIGGLLCFLFALFSGWFQEGISIPFIATLWVLFVFYKRYRNRKNLLILLGYTLGTCLIVFSPGTLHRLSTNEIPHTGGFLFVVCSKILNTNAALSGVLIFWLSAFLLLFLFFRKRKWIYDNYVDVLLWLFNTLFFYTLGFGEERITFLLSVVSFILVMRYINNSYQQLLNYSRWKFTVLIFMMLAASFYASFLCYDYNKWVDDLQSKIENNKDEHAVISHDPYLRKNRFIYVEQIKEETTETSNKKFAMYFDKKSIQCLNSELFDGIYNQSFDLKPLSGFVSQSGSPICFNDKLSKYAIEIPIENFNSELEVVAHHPIDLSNLTPKQMFIRKILKTLDNGIEEVPSFLILKDNKCYCLFNGFQANTVSLDFVDSEGNLINSYKKYNSNEEDLNTHSLL